MGVDLVTGHGVLFGNLLEVAKKLLLPSYKLGFDLLVFELEFYVEPEG